MKFLFFTNYLDNGELGCIQVVSVILIFFLLELFLKVESYGKPICQTEAEALWLKGAGAYTGPGRPSSLRYSRSLLACRRMIQKPSSSRLRGECNLNRN